MTSLISVSNCGFLCRKRRCRGKARTSGLQVNQARGGGRPAVRCPIRRSERPAVPGRRQCGHAPATRVRGDTSQLFSHTANRPVTVSADTQSHVLPPGGCCVPGIGGHYSALNENRGPLGRKGKLVEAGSETQEGEDGPEEQDAGRRHGRVTPAVMPPADWLFRQEKRRVARGAWPTEWTPTSGRSHSRVCSSSPLRPQVTQVSLPLTWNPMDDNTSPVCLRGEQGKGYLFSK